MPTSARLRGDSSKIGVDGSAISRLTSEGEEGVRHSNHGKEILMDDQNSPLYDRLTEMLTVSIAVEVLARMIRRILVTAL